MKIPRKTLIVTSLLIGAASWGIHLHTLNEHRYPQLPTVTHPVSAPVAGEVFALVNNERVKAGLAPLTDDPRLDTAAMEKCQDMVTRNYWGHTTPDGVQFYQFIKNERIVYYSAGENLEFGPPHDSVTAVVDWMNSPEHRANILNGQFNSVGTAICHADNYQNKTNQYIDVQEFAQE